MGGMGGMPGMGVFPCVVFAAGVVQHVRDGQAEVCVG